MTLLLLLLLKLIVVVLFHTHIAVHLTRRALVFPAAVRTAIPTSAMHVISTFHFGCGLKLAGLGNAVAINTAVPAVIGGRCLPTVAVIVAALPAQAIIGTGASPINAASAPATIPAIVGAGRVRTRTRPQSTALLVLLLVLVLVVLRLLVIIETLVRHRSRH